MRVNGIPCSEEEEISFFDDGTLHEATLAEESVIEGVPCRGQTEVVFYPSGQLKLAFTRAFQREGISIACGGPTYWHENGRIASAELADDCTLDGHTCRRESRVALDDQGHLLEISESIEGDCSIQGIPVSSLFDVWYYPNGQLSCAVLSRASVVGDKRLEPWTEIYFDESGFLTRSVRLSIEPGEEYRQRAYGAIGLSWS